MRYEIQSEGLTWILFDMWKKKKVAGYFSPDGRYPLGAVNWTVSEDYLFCNLPKGRLSFLNNLDLNKNRLICLCPMFSVMTENILCMHDGAKYREACLNFLFFAFVWIFYVIFQKKRIVIQ